MKKHLLLFSAIVLLIVSCTYEKGEIPVIIDPKSPTGTATGPVCDSTIHYSSNIANIITTSCSGDHNVSCHESGSNNGDYTIYSVLKSKADNGTLNNQVYKTRLMPKTPMTITEEQINNIYCWIKQGAPEN